MKIPVLIEPIASGGFRARAGEPFLLFGDGATAQEAMRCLEEKLADRLRSGAQLGFLDVANGAPGLAPPLPADDLYKTDWVFRELQEAIAENRRLEDSPGP